MNNGKRAYTLSILVEDTPGVLSQVARLFSRKGYNIESICAGATTKPGITRISVIAVVDEAAIRQLATQLSKLLLVISVEVLTGDDSIHRELTFIKVKAETRDQRDEIIQIVNVFRASILDMGKESLTIAVVGDDEKTKAIIDLLEGFGILETARSGTIALQRGKHTIYDYNKTKEEYDYGKSLI